MTAAAATRDLARVGDPALAKFLPGFFQCHKGGYGEGDRFRGVKVPVIRRTARAYRALPLPQLQRLLVSPFHEDRMLALVVLAHQAQRADPDGAWMLCQFYLRNRRGVNNWDLVDMSAPNLVGPHLARLAKQIDALSRSKNLWDRRISILAHMHDIRAGNVSGFYAFAPRFLDDPHDLIHKAVGWLLREAGQRGGTKALTAFLDRYQARMPRTMLRYAIEKLSLEQRRVYVPGRPNRP